MSSLLIKSEKSCSSCGEKKPNTKDFFVPHKDCIGGLGGLCRTCDSFRGKTWRENNKERRRIDWATRYNSNKEKYARENKERREKNPLFYRAVEMVSCSRKHARKLMVPFDTTITARLVRDVILENPNCPCCGVTYSLEWEGVGRNPKTPSLDRFDSKRGYTLDNVNLVCWRCNMVKGDASIKELETVLAWMKGVVG